MIILKVNIIARLKFELGYILAAVQQVGHYALETFSYSWLVGYLLLEHTTLEVFLVPNPVHTYISNIYDL